MRILIVGGSKSGKSGAAQRMIASFGPPMYYWATMEPTDAEDEARIEKHLLDREGLGFITIECGRELSRELPLPEGANVMLDSVTALLANEMFSGPEPDPSAPERTLSELIVLSEQAENLVCVCDDLFRGGLYGDWTDAYMRGLGKILTELAERFDAVFEAVSGTLKPHKGRLPDPGGII